MKHNQKRPEAPKKERVRSSFAMKLLIVVLLVGGGLQLWHLSGQVSNARQENEELALDVAQIQQENTALRDDINDGATTEKMKELARKELDYVDPGTYQFQVSGLEGSNTRPSNEH